MTRGAAQALFVAMLVLVCYVVQQQQGAFLAVLPPQPDGRLSLHSNYHRGAAQTVTASDADRRPALLLPLNNTQPQCQVLPELARRTCQPPTYRLPRHLSREFLLSQDPLVAKITRLHVAYRRDHGTASDDPEAGRAMPNACTRRLTSTVLEYDDCPSLLELRDDGTVVAATGATAANDTAMEPVLTLHGSGFDHDEVRVGGGICRHGSVRRAPHRPDQELSCRLAPGEQHVPQAVTVVTRYGTSNAVLVWRGPPTTPTPGWRAAPHKSPSWTAARLAARQQPALLSITTAVIGGAASAVATSVAGLAGGCHMTPDGRTLQQCERNDDWIVVTLSGYLLLLLLPTAAAVTAAVTPQWQVPGICQTGAGVTALQFGVQYTCVLRNGVDVSAEDGATWRTAWINTTLGPTNSLAVSYRSQDMSIRDTWLHRDVQQFARSAQCCDGWQSQPEEHGVDCGGPVCEPCHRRRRATAEPPPLPSCAAGVTNHRYTGNATSADNATHHRLTDGSPSIRHGTDVRQSPPATCMHAVRSVLPPRRYLPFLQRVWLPPADLAHDTVGRFRYLQALSSSAAAYISIQSSDTRILAAYCRTSQPAAAPSLPVSRRSLSSATSAASSAPQRHEAKSFRSLLQQKFVLMVGDSLVRLVYSQLHRAMRISRCAARPPGNRSAVAAAAAAGIVRREPRELRDRQRYHTALDPLHELCSGDRHHSSCVIVLRDNTLLQLHRYARHHSNGTGTANGAAATGTTTTVPALDLERLDSDLADATLLMFYWWNYGETDPVRAPHGANGEPAASFPPSPAALQQLVQNSELRDALRRRNAAFAQPSLVVTGIGFHLMQHSVVAANFTVDNVYALSHRFMRQVQQAYPTSLRVWQSVSCPNMWTASQLVKQVTVERARIVLHAQNRAAHDTNTEMLPMYAIAERYLTMCHDGLHFAGLVAPLAARMLLHRLAIGEMPLLCDAGSVPPATAAVTAELTS